MKSNKYLRLVVLNFWSKFEQPLSRRRESDAVPRAESGLEKLGKFASKISKKIIFRVL